MNAIIDKLNLLTENKESGTDDKDNGDEKDDTETA